MNIGTNNIDSIPKIEHKIIDKDNIKISACILSRNDDKLIKECIHILGPYVDDIIIFDSNDNDASINQVKSIPDIGHKLIIKHKKGEIIQDFAKERNDMQSIASGDYVLHVDCDERFNVDFLKDIKDIIRKYLGDNILPILFRFPRINQPDSINYPDYQIRLLFKKYTTWRKMSHETPYIVYLPENPIQDIGMKIKNMITLDNYPITHIYKEKSQLQKRWIDIVHKDPFRRQKRLLVLSMFKNSGIWANDILKCMTGLYKYNERLYDKDRDKLDIQFSFIDGQSSDDTFSILEKYCQEGSILDIQLRRFEPDIQDIDHKGEYLRFKRLATVRNHLIEQSAIQFPLNDDDYILFADSDVKFSENIIHELIKDMRLCHADIIAPMIYIEDFREYGNSYFYDVLAFRSLDGIPFNHFVPYYPNLDIGRPNLVNSVGSFYIMKYKAARYAKFTGNSDSEQVEFCDRARSLGFQIYVSPRLSVSHVNFDKYGLAWH